MDSAKLRLGQKAREKLLEKIEQARTSGLVAASPASGEFTQTAVDPTSHNSSKESPLEATAVVPRLKPYFLPPIASSQPTSSPPAFIDVDAYTPSLADSAPPSSSSKRKSDFSPPSTMKKGRILESPSLAQTLSLEQLQEHLSQSEKSREHLQAEVHQLQGFLRDKEEHCSALGQRVLSFSERVRELESALGASSSRVIQLQEAHTAEVKQLLLTHAQELEHAQVSSFTQGRRVGLDQGASSGIPDCKSNLLMTPQGQAFLDSLVRHLPEAYLHTPDFWLRMLDPLTKWTATAILECCQQLGIPEQAASINAGPILRMFETEPETLKRNHFLSAKEPWFMPVLREASQVLCQPTQPSEKLPPWDAPRFPLFPLNTMVMRSIRKAFDEVLFLSF